MEKSLTIIRNMQPVISSVVFAKELETEHRRLRELLKKYREEFLDFGEILEAELSRPDGKKSITKNTKRGAPTKEFFLNEGQSIYLLVLLGNTDRVRHFKKKLAQDFLRQRKFIAKISSQKDSAEWINARTDGKNQRKEETDSIKKFVEYAKSQGSKSSEKYYINISKMQNQALFSVDFLNQKFPNVREVVSKFSLSALKVCDHVISKVLEEEMEKNTPYKEIYVIAKDRVILFANTIGQLEVCQAIACIDSTPQLTDV